MNELKKIKEIKLTDPEKKMLFDRIQNIIRDLPGNENIDLNYRVKSPYYKFSFFLEKKYVRVGLMSAFILLLSSATAFASLDTLPGDLLYGVKVNVVEKASDIISFSPASKAKNDSVKIDKRIDEFEKLAEKGKLTEENSKKLEEDITKHLGDFDSNIQEIKQDGRDTEKHDLEIELESNLKKHGEKIREIKRNGRVSDEHALESVLNRIP